MPDSHIVFVLVKNEFFILFVYCVVCEMHAHVLHVILVRSDVGFSSKATQALTEDKHA